MSGNIESFTTTARPAHPAEWATHDGTNSHSGESWTGSLVDFAERNWKEIAGIGVLAAAGTLFIASRGSNLGMLTRVLKGGGETAAELEGTGLAGTGITADVAARLKNVDHFVFDMDRTLVDHDGALAALKQTMSSELVAQTKMSPEFINGALQQTEARLGSPYFWRNLNEIKPLQEMYPGINLNERFAGVTQSADAAFKAALTPKPETTELLNYLRGEGKTVSVFTAGNPARALEKLNGAGLLDHVDNIYTSGLNAFEDSPASGLLTQETTASRVIPLAVDAKSSGTGYQAIINDLRTTPKQLAMTGDHVVEDVANSKAYGYFASQAKWYRAQPAESVLPDLELYSPSDLTNVLKQLH